MLKPLLIITAVFVAVWDVVTIIDMINGLHTEPMFNVFCSLALVVVMDITKGYAVFATYEFLNSVLIREKKGKTGPRSPIPTVIRVFISITSFNSHNSALCR